VNPSTIRPYSPSDSYLKHITFHEARKEAEKPLREAKGRVRILEREVERLERRMREVRTQARSEATRYRARSYFRTRHASSVINVIILIHYSNPFLAIRFAYCRLWGGRKGRRK